MESKLEETDFELKTFKKYTTGPGNLLCLNDSTQQNKHDTPNNVPFLSFRMPLPLLNIIEKIQTKKYTDAFGCNVENIGTQAFEELAAIFHKHNIPIGLLGNLVALSHYKLVFLVDDSFSMTNGSDLQANFTSNYMSSKINRKSTSCVTRWEDTEDRLHQMIDLLAYIPTGPISISFLNSSKSITWPRDKGESFQQFKKNAHTQISSIFSRVQPHNSTPLFENMERLINTAASASKLIPTAFYIITDGEPNRGAYDIARIQRLLLGDQPSNRNGLNSYDLRDIRSYRTKNAQLFPVTFIDCTNKPEYTEWTRELEEESESSKNMLYIAAVEDYIDECRQVLQFQGPGFPYTRGLWLLASLTAALDPNGLDAMDQPEPLSKSVFDCLLGRVHSEKEYWDYFSQHGYAMKYFKEDFELFLYVQNEGEIPSVINFREILANRLRNAINQGDDNCELNEIYNTGSLIRSMRAEGKLDFYNYTLRSKIAKGVYQQAKENESNLTSTLPVTADYYRYPGKPKHGLIPQQSLSLKRNSSLLEKTGVIIPRTVQLETIKAINNYITVYTKKAYQRKLSFFNTSNNERDSIDAAIILLEFLNSNFTTIAGMNKNRLRALLDRSFIWGDSRLRDLTTQALGFGNVLELQTILSRMCNDDILILGEAGKIIAAKAESLPAKGARNDLFC